MIIKKPNLKLFACFVGGRITTCTIELHDIFFFVAQKIEDTYMPIVEKWWGDSYIHLDSYIDLSIIENYLVEPTKKYQNQEEKLFFINFGSYKPKVFGEVHNYIFVIADSRTEAIKKAKSKLNNICGDYTMMHLDDSIELEPDDCIDLSQKYHLKLTKIDTFSDPEIIHTNKRLLLNKDNPKYLF